jgi:hypothetical protein
VAARGDRRARIDAPQPAAVGLRRDPEIDQRFRKQQFPGDPRAGNPARGDQIVDLALAEPQIGRDFRRRHQVLIEMLAGHLERSGPIPYI